MAEKKEIAKELEKKSEKAAASTKSKSIKRSNSAETPAVDAGAAKKSSGKKTAVTAGKSSKSSAAAAVVSDSVTSSVAYAPNVTPTINNIKSIFIFIPYFSFIIFSTSRIKSIAGFVSFLAVSKISCAAACIFNLL